MSNWQMEATRWLKDRVPSHQRRRLVKMRLAARSTLGGLRGLPDLLVIGAQRCGTSSLYKYLGAHPQVIPSLRKEIEYFSTRYPEGEDWYRSHFPLRFRPGLAGKLTFEATPDYMLDPRAAERAAQLVPNARIVALVRNPITRAYSQYQHNRRLGHEPLSFDDALEAEEERTRDEVERLMADPEYRALPLRRHAYVGRGMYADQLRLWQERYPSDRILVARFEDLIETPAETLHTIERFLGIEEWLPGSFSNHSYGLDGRVATAPMSDAARNRLEAVFAPANRDLEALLGRSVEWSTDGDGRLVE